MPRGINARRTVFGVLAAGAACAALAIPSAGAEPSEQPLADCSASSLSATISSVTKSLSDYFAAHPDVNQAMIDITRQPGIVAVGQFDGYFKDHPQEADEVRAIKQPLVDYQNRCGMQVEPAEALVVIGEL
jgi:hemophore-related protein